MKKWKIAIIVIIVLALIAGIICLIVKGSKKEMVEVVDLNNALTVEADSFAGIVIGDDRSNISIIPNDGELIKETFQIVEATVTNDTVVEINGVEAEAKDIDAGATITVEFNGKVYQTAPARVLAQKLIVTQDVEE